MRRFKRIYPIVPLILLSMILFGKEPVPVIALQPLGKVRNEILQEVKKGITKVYRVRVEILPTVPLPKKAWYPPRRRYRGEKLLNFLQKNTPKKYLKVVGLTTRDISTTKGKFKDWGIFGLGSLGGRACVISTFRLRRGRVSHRYFIGRLVKVVNHEVGHTFGVGHCPNQRCLMEDAKGTIKTVDRETGAFCGECRERLKNILK